MSFKKYVDGSDRSETKLDSILRPGDWVLKWDPNAPMDQTGFALFTPKDFDPEEGGGPLGGLILAAVYFLLENDDSSFPKELVRRANELAKEVKRKHEEKSSLGLPPGRTLN